MSESPADNNKPEETQQPAEPKPIKFTGILSFLNDGFGPRLQKIVVLVMVLNVACGVYLTTLTPKFGAPYLILTLVILGLWAFFIREFNKATPAKAE